MATDALSNPLTGTHEVQECHEGQNEVDLHTHLRNCEKNPSHSGFIPVNQLKINHIPYAYRNMDIYNLIKALAALTVRIAVNFTSPDRPEFVPGTNDPYPCYNSRDQNTLRTGTGTVWRIVKYTEVMWGNYRPCPCPDCCNSDVPQKVWWEVRVLTATHVVFDSIEARHSSCRLYFDDENSPVVKIYGWQLGGSNIENDLCMLFCATHDENLGARLDNELSEFFSCSRKVDAYIKSRKKLDKLTILVSHPHGCSKQISFGEWVDRRMMGKDLTAYTYTNSTCPGSSGARVYRLGYRSPYHPHIGVNSIGLNFSGNGVELDKETEEMEDFYIKQQISRSRQKDDIDSTSSDDDDKHFTSDDEDLSEIRQLSERKIKLLRRKEKRLRDPEHYYH